MILIWMERVLRDSVDDDPFYTVDHLVKVEDEDFYAVMGYFQKAWARREDMGCESVIKSYELPEDQAHLDSFYAGYEEPLVIMDENGERSLHKEKGNRHDIPVRVFDSKALDYKYYYTVYGDPVFGGVNLEFQLPIHSKGQKLDSKRGIYANSFGEALEKAFQKN